jgi:hypothetical protein
MMVFIRETLFAGKAPCRACSRNERLVRRDLDAVDLVPGQVAVHPLDLVVLHNRSRRSLRQEVDVPRINWGRVVAGGLTAAVIAFFSDGFLHEKLVGADWSAVYRALGIAEPEHDASGLAYFAVFELGRGLVSVLFYALMRAQFGAGPRTAAWAGVAAWIAFSLTGPAQFVPLGFYSNALWLKVSAFQLVSSIVATVAGAALYKEP